MITTLRSISLIEECCTHLGVRLHHDSLNGYELADIETSLLLIDGAIARYMGDSVNRNGGPTLLCAARAAHNRMHDRLDLVSRRRDELLVEELRGLLREAQSHTLQALVALRVDQENERRLMCSGGITGRAITPESARFTASQIRMGIGRTRK